MLLAIPLGVISGVIGFVPLVVGLYLTKRNPQEGNFAPMMKLLLGLFASFILLFVAAVLFAMYDKPSALAFVISEVIALCASAIGFGVWSQVRK